MKVPPRATRVEQAAAAIVQCARTPRAHVYVGLAAHALSLQHRVSPRLTDWAMARVMPKLVIGGRPAPATAASFEADEPLDRWAPPPPETPTPAGRMGVMEEAADQNGSHG